MNNQERFNDLAKTVNTAWERLKTMDGKISFNGAGDSNDMLDYLIAQREHGDAANDFHSFLGSFKGKEINPKAEYIV